MKPEYVDAGWTNSDPVQAVEESGLDKLLEEDYDPPWSMIYDDRVIQFREKFEEEWESRKKYAVLMDCSSVKPYSYSPTHMKVIAEIDKQGLDHKMQQYICSEPMGIVPREWETIYPCTHYNLILRPSGQGGKGYDEMVKVFKKQFNKLLNYHEHFITFMPSNKQGMVIKAVDGRTQVIKIPYGLYENPPLQQIVDEIEQTGDCTLFEHVNGWSRTGVK